MASTSNGSVSASTRRRCGPGVELDPEANEAGSPPIGTDASRVSAWVIPSDEELMIAHHTRALLAP